MSRFWRSFLFTLCIVSISAEFCFAGIITGYVKDSNGNGIPNASIQIHSTGWNSYLAYNTTSGNDGSYSINLTTPGYYVFAAFSTSNKYYGPYYYGTNTTSDAGAFLDAIKVTSSSVTEIDPVITESYGYISGKITLTNGTAVANQFVNCANINSVSSFGSGITNAEGVFGISVAPGTYYCSTYYNGKTFYYDNTTNFSAKTYIDISANSDKTGINFTVSGSQSNKVVVVPLGQ